MSGLVRALPRLRVPGLPKWPVLRRRLIVAALVLVTLAAGYMLWLRDSSLVAVEKVTVRGAEQSPAVESALQSAGLEQSTLHVDPQALEDAVAGDPAVRSLSAQADFPHGLTIDVDLREPVGYLKGHGVLVAGDGVILNDDAARPESVAAIGVKGSGLIGGGQVRGDALEVARVLGATPAPMLPAVERSSVDPELGVLVEVQGGLELRFGDPGQADLKWRAAAAVLAQPNFTGATYLDLSVPDRPVAGGVEEASETTEGVESAAAEVVPEEAVAVPEPVVPEAVEAVPVVPETAPDPAATGAVGTIE